MSQRFDRKVKGGWTPDEIYDQEFSLLEGALGDGSITSEVYLQRMIELNEWFEQEEAAIAQLQ